MLRERFSVLGGNASVRLAMLGSIRATTLVPLEESVRLAGVRAHTRKHDPDFLLIKLPLIWLERACFRAKLRADLRDDPDLLRDIGISVHEAQAESIRSFWEPVLLTPRETT